MLIAQTGSNTQSSLKEQQASLTDPQGSAPVSNLWWMLPLAAAIFAIAWYLRPKKVALQPSAKSSKDSDRKLATRSKVKNVVADSQSLDASTREQPQATAALQSTGSKSGGSKKKKSNKKKTTSNDKRSQSIPAVAATADVKQPTDDLPKPAIQSVETVAAEKEIVPPRPVAAIFEPLRDAVKERRKQQYGDESDDEADSNTSSNRREPDLVNQLFGGKFERIVPRASIRSHADRWPATATQPVKKTETIVSRPQPVETAKPEAVSVPVAPAPAKGLKSFVSKVVKSDASID